jgi:hypothetical protein
VLIQGTYIKVDLNCIDPTLAHSVKLYKSMSNKNLKVPVVWSYSAELDYNSFSKNGRHALFLREGKAYGAGPTFSDPRRFDVYYKNKVSQFNKLELVRPFDPVRYRSVWDWFRDPLVQEFRNKPTEPQLRDLCESYEILLAELLEWNSVMGGWEAGCWKRARRMVRQARKRRAT